MFDSRGTMCGSPNHGGLTPAAFVHVRFCIAKIVFSPANVRSAPRAGGVSQPWCGKRMCGAKRNHSAKNDHRCKRESEPRRADAHRSWLCVRQPPDNVRFSRHNVRFTEPRRADARRSYERAFVHRKWRFVQRANVVHQERLA
jgi:hypothetical protein